MTTTPDAREMLARIPFHDDADEPKTWRGLAHSILLDMFRYAKDAGPERRLTSAVAYVDDALRLASAAAGGNPIHESDGGVESRHAATGNKTGATPEEAECHSATSFERGVEQGAAIQPCAGVAPGPSDTSLRLREVLDCAASYAQGLANIKVAIVEADPSVLTDTLWMPDRVFKGGTVADYIDHLMGSRPSVNEGQRKDGAWSARKHDEIITRLMADVGMPNSHSLYTAFHQLANELHALAHAPDDGRTVTIKIPSGYVNAEDFIKDCGFELALTALPPSRESSEGVGR